MHKLDRSVSFVTQLILTYFILPQLTSRRELATPKRYLSLIFFFLS